MGSTFARQTTAALLVLLCGLAAGCGGRGSASPTTPPAAPTTVSIAGATSLLDTGATRTFTASVANNGNTAVTWSVLESTGGSITQQGVYTSPSLPGTFTIRAVSQADPNAAASVRIPVAIPVRHVSGYDVGVDYHAYGSDFLKTAFLTIYHQPGIRDTVRSQLQAMADRGATVIFTRIWMVTEPGTTDFGETWRATFPLSDQEQANLRAYAQDVAAVQGSGGNRLRLDICLLWLGAADYTRGTPATGLGFSNISAAEYTARVELTTDKVIAGVRDVVRPDGLHVVDSIYFLGEAMLDDPVPPRPNEDWLFLTHYPRFVNKVTAAGFTPSVYFGLAERPADLLDSTFLDAKYPILNGHRSMFWTYRTLRYMKTHGLPLPPRIDFSWYINSTQPEDYAALLARTLDDADATLPSLGAPRLYGAAESSYFLDAAQRRSMGQAFASEALKNPRLRRVCFWTTPDGGGPGINVAFPFAFEDYFPPPG